MLFKTKEQKHKKKQPCEYLQIRLKNGEKEDLKYYAELEGLTVTDLVKKAVNEYVSKTHKQVR